MGGKFDIIGTADIYFRYDAFGRIKALKLEFKEDKKNRDVVSYNLIGSDQPFLHVI